MLKMFRSIGMMSSSVLPDFMQEFYARLAVFTLDFEFAQPGCGGTSSSFMDVTILNAMLLGTVLAPVVIGMPILALVYGGMYRGRWSSRFFDEKFWPAVERHPSWSRLMPRVEQTQAQDRYFDWEARLVFGVLAWFELSCFIVCSRAIQSIFCQYLDGEFRLATDRTVVCGSTTQAWVFHTCGAMLTIFICVAFPGFIVMKVKKIKARKLWDSAAMEDKYGSFYADFREDGTLSSYFYVLCHLVENIACALIEASMSDDTYGMYIATGVLIVVYMIVITAVRPHAEVETFWFVQSLNTLLVYSLVIAYSSDKLSESGEALSEAETKGLLAASGITLVLMVAFTVYVSLPIAEFAKELYDNICEKLSDRKGDFAPILLRQGSHVSQQHAKHHGDHHRQTSAMVMKLFLKAIWSRVSGTPKVPPHPAQLPESPRPYKAPSSPIKPAQSPRPWRGRSGASSANSSPSPSPSPSSQHVRGLERSRRTRILNDSSALPSSPGRLSRFVVANHISSVNSVHPDEETQLQLELESLRMSELRAAFDAGWSDCVPLWV
jgi:hypothetical protein